MSSIQNAQQFAEALKAAKNSDAEFDTLSRLFEVHHLYPEQMAQLKQQDPNLLKLLRRFAEDISKHLRLPLMHRRKDWYQRLETAPSPIKLAGERKVGPLTLIRHFQEGSLGTQTYLALHDEGYLCLFKRYFPHQVDLLPDTMFQHQERMIQRLNQIEDPRIEEVLDHFVWKEDSYVQIKPFLRCHSFFDWFEQYKDRRIRLRMLHRIGEVLQVLHANEIAHMDFKPEQVLLLASPNSESIEEDPDFVLIDYDFSMIAGEVTASVGSVPFYAPEQFSELSPPRTLKAGIKADVYAFAVFAHLMLSEHYPFGDGHTVQTHLDGLKQSPWLNDVFVPYPPLRKILKAAIDPNPQARPDLSEVLDGLKDPELMKRAHMFLTERNPETHKHVLSFDDFFVLLLVGFLLTLLLLFWLL